MNKNEGSDVVDIREVLERRAAALARVTRHEEAAASAGNVMVFEAGGTRYGVDLDRIREVQPLDQRTWSRIPCTPDFVVGAVNIRGHIYSIVDISTYLGGQQKEIPDTAHVLLASAGSTDRGETMEICLLANDLPASRSLEEGQVKPPTTAISPRAQPFVRGVTTDIVLVLDLDRLLSDPGLIVNEEP